MRRIRRRTGLNSNSTRMYGWIPGLLRRPVRGLPSRSKLATLSGPLPPRASHCAELGYFACWIGARGLPSRTARGHSYRNAGGLGRSRSPGTLIWLDLADRRYWRSASIFVAWPHPLPLRRPEPLCREPLQGRGVRIGKTCPSAQAGGAGCILELPLGRICLATSVGCGCLGGFVGVQPASVCAHVSPAHHFARWAVDSAVYWQSYGGLGSAAFWRTLLGCILRWSGHRSGLVEDAQRPASPLGRTAPDDRHRDSDAPSRRA